MENLVNQFFAGQLHSQYSAWLLLLAFVGGVVSSLSPCSLGLLPIIVGYVGGSSENTWKKNAIQVVFFVLGLSLVLTVFGVISAVAGQAYGSQAGPLWALIMASLILVMGLSLMEIIEIPMPTIIKKMPQNKNNSLIVYPIVLGGAFAFASSPCATPILAGIMAYASIKANILLGGLLLFLYSLGQGMILVIAALFTTMFKKLLIVRAVSGHMMKFSGAVLILSSIFIYLKIFGVM
ncbi:MAG: cytochrome c biogenesis CcdA family protein [Candidatus Gastranaerophilales bacterium]|nr:cytochrome c biogenesis CcdA family protein [Candidatus Gastranaerophilales bacterium]